MRSTIPKRFWPFWNNTSEKPYSKKTASKVKTTGEAGGLHRSYKGLIQQRLKTHERFANRK